MPPAPIPYNEPDRVRAMEHHCLTGQRDATADDFAAVTAALASCPTALVSIVQGDRQWFMGSSGLDVTETPREHAFCAYTILKSTPLVVPDATLDPRFADNPLVTGPLGLRFYAGVPLITEKNTALGTLCVIDYEPRTIDDTLLVSMCRMRDLVVGFLRSRAESIVFRTESEAKSSFLANMSHEIRTPMTAILGFSELIENRSGEQDFDPRSAARTISRSGTHLLELLNDILDISKYDAGRISPEVLVFSPERLVRDTAKLFQAKADTLGVGFRVRLDEALPESVRCDPTRLRQVLINLISNAIKFTTRGEITVGVGYENAANQPGRLVIEVRDTGIGMAPDALERIRRCEAFNQADASISRKFGGTGLGLSICASIAKLLGGTLTIDSEEGVGSTFRFSVAAEASEAERPSSPMERKNRLSETTEPAQASTIVGRSVLVAEDGLDNQRLIRNHLTGAGAVVEIVENGEKLVRRATERRRVQDDPDIILVDLHMPVLNGIQAVRKLRAMGIAAPIAALSADNTPETVAECRAAGFDTHLSKPFTRRSFVVACAGLIRDHRRAA